MKPVKTRKPSLEVVPTILCKHFQDGGHRHLGFSKIRNFNGRSAVRDPYAYNCAKFHQNWSNGCRDMTGFQNGGPVPSLIFEIQTTTDAEFLHTVTLNFELCP